MYKKTFFSRQALLHLENVLALVRPSFFTVLEISRFIEGNMKFTVLEPDDRAHEFVLTGDKLGQEALDKVRSI